MRKRTVVGALLLLVTVSVAIASTSYDAERARQNFLLHCVGCHGEDGRGLEGHVPSLHGTFAKFAAEPRGRAYLLGVPGVTQSSLSPERVAEVMNWALREYSTPQAAARVKPFTAAEVSTARKKPLLEVFSTRAEIAAQY
jgi:mono/diheme cytochrome c family protein